jgi:hypothetical protein
MLPVKHFDVGDAVGEAALSEGFSVSEAMNLGIWRFICRVELV